MKRKRAPNNPMCEHGQADRYMDGRCRICCKLRRRAYYEERHPNAKWMPRIVERPHCPTCGQVLPATDWTET
jgi:hypothetical protein